MKSKLKERFARLGPIRDVPRVSSGSPVALVLRPMTDRTILATISATKALVARGMTMLRAKRAIEAALEGEAVIEVPMVEHLPALASEFREAGFEVTRIATDPFDVREFRERLGMSQEQFAHRYGLEIDALRNWEQGRRPLEGTALRYLRAIKADPIGAARAQEEAI
jgi:DNA-binding transcriptional regulator YiaG